MQQKRQWLCFYLAPGAAALQVAVITYFPLQFSSPRFTAEKLAARASVAITLVKKKKKSEKRGV